MRELIGTIAEIATFFGLALFWVALTVGAVAKGYAVKAALASPVALLFVLLGAFFLAEKAGWINYD